MQQVLPWVAFNLLVFIMLAVDLGFFQRKAHAVGMREALIWCLICIFVAVCFNIGLWYFRGSQSALEFLAGYLIEMALSVDNIFVFVLIFTYFNVPARYQHRVLFWGILGALIMRGAMIGMGAFLISRFDWILYIFGAFLVFTGIKMAFHKDTEIHPESNPVLKLVRRFLPVSNVYHGQNFFVRGEAEGKPGVRWIATPLFVVLVLIETTDLVFAVDSIPAVFAVTKDPLIVYTSNVFAILCLRAMYFLLAGIIHKFRFLQLGLAVVLSFVGVKMLIHGWWHIPIALSLAVIVGVLTTSVVASILFPAKPALGPAPKVASIPEEETADENDAK
ncbi:MAG: TerC family protein [FCB group bacterium]|jgi:tellurite resistance protein TerC|nr:TerC family protein [FCB group bacterium]